MPVIDDVASALIERLRNPIKAKPLDKQIKAGMKVVLICDDYTRPTPAHLILPPLLDELNRLGVKDDDIKILVSAGHHREMTNEEKKKKYGEPVCSRIEIIHHFSEDENRLTKIGRSSTDIDIWINSLAVEADFTIGLGLVEIHPWAGFAGGGKIVNPGIAGKKTINQTHSLPILADVGIGKTRENPFWRTSIESAKMLPLNLLINCLLDVEERIIEIAIGETESAQLWLIEKFRYVNELKFPEPADIVITTAYPKFQQWGQAAISLYNAARIVKDGGVRITVADCPEDIGDSQEEKDFYYRSLSTKHNSPRDYWDNWLGEENCYSRNTCAIYKHLCDSEKSEGIIVTENLPTGLINQPVMRTIDQAISYAFDKCGRNAKIAVYDKGAMVLVSL